MVMEVVFTVIYACEAAIKIFAVGFLPYWQLKINKLDFLIVAMALVRHSECVRFHCRVCLFSFLYEFHGACQRLAT